MKKWLLILITIGAIFIVAVFLFIYWGKVKDNRYCMQFEEQIDIQDRYSCTVADEFQKEGIKFIRLNITTTELSKLEVPSYKINKQTLEVTEWDK